MSKETVRQQARGVERVDLAVRFWPNGTSDPATVYVDNGNTAEVTVTRSGAGEWTLTLDESVRRVLHCGLGLGLATPADNSLSATIDKEGTASDLQVVITNAPAGTPTDIAADADNWISVLLSVEQAVGITS